MLKGVLPKGIGSSLCLQDLFTTRAHDRFRERGLRQAHARICGGREFRREENPGFACLWLTKVEIEIWVEFAYGVNCGGVISLDPLDKALLIVIARKMPPMAQATLKLLGQATGAAPTVAKVRAAVARLRKAGIVSIEGRADVQIEDRLFAEYLAAL